MAIKKTVKKAVKSAKATKKVAKNLIRIQVSLSFKEKKTIEKVAKKNKVSVSAFIRSLVQAL